MKTLARKRSNLFRMAGLNLFVPVMILLFPLSITINAGAGESVSYEGTIKGAACTHYKLDCSDNDTHITIENDFVLVMPGDMHYFMPNLNRALKARYANKAVRVSGDMDKMNHYIWVETLELKKGNKYQPIWSRQEQQELYKGGGG